MFKTNKQASSKSIFNHSFPLCPNCVRKGKQNYIDNSTSDFVDACRHNDYFFHSPNASLEERLEELYKQKTVNHNSGK